jgi:hypothetical protein
VVEILLKENEDLLEKASYFEEIESNVWGCWMGCICGKKHHIHVVKDSWNCEIKKYILNFWNFWIS